MSGNGPFNQQETLVFLDPYDTKVLHRHLAVAVLPGHASALHGMLGIAAPDGPSVTETFMSSVGHGRSAEMVALDYSGESSALRSSHDINEISWIENIYIDWLPQLK